MESDYKLLKHLAIGINILFVFILLFNYLNFLPDFWSIRYIFFFVVFINTIFLMNKIKNIPEDKRKDSSLLYFLGHFFILSLIVIAVNQFLKRQIVIDFLPELIALSIALGFLTFYANKEKVEKELDDEKEKEELEEEKRKKEFPNKFPLINKIPLLRSFVKWMYKEGWWYSLGLIVIVVVGLLLRLLPIFRVKSIQGGFHLLRVSRGIMQTGLPLMDSGVIYLRATIFQYLLAGSRVLFGESMLAISLVPLIFSILTIILVYELAKKINKPFALLTSLLFAIFPYIIVYSRHRFYSMTIFFILVSFYYVIKDNSTSSKVYYFLASVVAISTSDVGMIVIIFPIVKLISSEEFRVNLLTLKKVINYPLIFLVVFTIINKMFLFGYKIPKSFGIGELKSFNFGSFLIFTNQIKFGYFYGILLDLFGVFLLLLLVVFSFFLIKNKNLLIKLSFISALLVYLAMSVLAGFKEQPRMLFILIPFVLIILSYILFIFVRIVIRNRLFSYIILAILIIGLNVSSLYFLVNINYGSEIPRALMESESFRYVFNTKDQAEYINSIDEKMLVITNNRWFDFYSEKSYLLVIDPSWIDFRVYQNYDGELRYLFTGKEVIYEKEKLQSVIKLNCENDTKIIIADFPDLQHVIKNVDSSLFENMNLLYHSEFENDSSSVWSIDCSSIN